MNIHGVKWVRDYMDLAVFWAEGAGAPKSSDG